MILLWIVGWGHRECRRGWHTRYHPGKYSSFALHLLPTVQSTRHRAQRRGGIVDATLAGWLLSPPVGVDYQSEQLQRRELAWLAFLGQLLPGHRQLRVAGRLR